MAAYSFITNKNPTHKEIQDRIVQALDSLLKIDYKQSDLFGKALYVEIKIEDAGTYFGSQKK